MTAAKVLSFQSTMTELTGVAFCSLRQRCETMFLRHRTPQGRACMHLWRETHDYLLQTLSQNVQPGVTLTCYNTQSTAVYYIREEHNRKKYPILNIHKLKHVTDQQIMANFY